MTLLKNLRYIFSSTDIEEELLALNYLGNKTMTTLADIQAAIAKAVADAKTEKEEVAGAIAALTEEINALKKTLAAGTGVTSADLDSLLSAVADLDTNIAAVYTAPVATV